MILKIIDSEAVYSHLSMAQCIGEIDSAMQLVSRGDLSMPNRIIMPLVDRSAYFAVMPGSLSQPRTYGAKVVSFHPGNSAAGRPAVQGFVILFDQDTGTPVAMLDGAAVTSLRTGAASGLATRELARPDASSLGVFGCGAQASVHIDAIRAVRDIQEIRVWSRSPEKVRAFVEDHQARTDAKIVAVENPRAAAECDVLCTTTLSPHPVLLGEWVRPGTHVNLVGAHTPTTREADTRLIAAGRIYVDALASAFSEAGEIMIPIAEGEIERDHIIGEIGALLLGEIEGRRDERDITVYKSLGVVAQDLVAAHAVYRRSQATP